ncbi:unnamed protein product [Adineta steineri]|uniref:Uncharacterized protein n=1 Tax=Adineta steineri TaxID=433720 RepID=A0A815CZQ8_9BILA|nr:unnamed protein product [Adineta steineri]CAF1286784.1 unnamed protein product [Adineta steineri]CAF3572138.1 unnamed protein product [Adineta steineri]CAF3614650.1 unnamed protein product [Adineta steineri]
MNNPRQGNQQSASNIKKLLNDIITQKATDEQPLERRQTPMGTTKDDAREINEILESSPPMTPTERSRLRDCCGPITPSTIIWYIGTCLLLIIAFVALVLSILFFINDSTTDKIIKLYGIIGAGVLALITFIIIFVDCWIDGTRLYLEEAVVYRVFQVKESDADAINSSNIRQKVNDGGQPQSLTLQQTSANHASHLYSYPPPYAYYPHLHHQHSHISHHHDHGHNHEHHHSHDHGHDHDHEHSHEHGRSHRRHYRTYLPGSHRSHQVHASSPISPELPIVLDESYKTKNTQPNPIKSSSEPSNKIKAPSKTSKTIHESKRGPQSKLKISDVISGTHIDPADDIRTATIHYGPIPRNVTEVIHETTIVEAPRSLLPTLRKTLMQNNKNIPNT